MYYYTCKAVLIYILHKFYRTRPIRPGINAYTLILPDLTNSTRHQCKWTNYTGLNRFNQASMEMDKFYHTRPIQPGINANGFPPNLITCTCIVNVKLNKYSCSRLLLDNGTLPYSNIFIFNVSE